jgi:hypothetical protein
MIVPRVDHQRHDEAQGGDRVGARHGDVHPGRAVRNDADRETERVARERRAGRGRERETVAPGAPGDEPAGEVGARDGERRDVAVEGPSGRHERGRRLTLGLEPGAGGQEHGVAANRNRLVVEPEIRRVVSRHHNAAEENRHPHPDLDRVGRAAPTGHPGEQIAAERPRDEAGVPQRIEQQGNRLPGFAWCAEPEGADAAPRRIHVERNRRPAIHLRRFGAEPHRRDRRLPGPRRVPERGRGAPHRAGRRERSETEEEDAGPGEKPVMDALREGRGGLGAVARQRVRPGAVRQPEQRLAGACRRRIEQGRDRPVAPAARFLQAPRDRAEREPAAGFPRHADDDGDRDRGTTPRRQHPPGRRQHAEAGEPRGASEHEGGEAHRPRRPSRPALRAKRPGETCQSLRGRDRRHPPYPTAYANRFTPIRSAASRFSGGS